VLDTRTGKRKCLPPYRALASRSGQPYSFSRERLRGKQADLGSSRFSAKPQAFEDQMFPEKVWGSVDAVNTDDLGMVVSAWDCANKTGEKNDFTANVVVARLGSGAFWKSKLNFAQLPDVVLQRYGLLIERYRTVPLLVVEDTACGTQLIDTIRSRNAEIPLIAAKGLVSLPRDAEWRADFIREMANFPVGVHDDACDGFFRFFYARCDATRIPRGFERCVRRGGDLQSPYHRVGASEPWPRQTRF